MVLRRLQGAYFVLCVFKQVLGFSNPCLELPGPKIFRVCAGASAADPYPVSFRSEGWTPSWTASTEVGNCSTIAGSARVARSQARDALSLRRAVICGASDYHSSKTVVNATIEETLRLVEGLTESYLRWNISVFSDEPELWSDGIRTHFSFNTSRSADCDPGGLSGICHWVAGASDVHDSGLAPRALGSAIYPLGGPYADPRRPRPTGEPVEVFAPSLVVPLWSFLNNDADLGISLAQSPDQPPVYAELAVEHTEGSASNFTYSRLFHRLGHGALTATFSQDIVFTSGDWRPGLAHMVQQWPAFFFPDTRSNFWRMEGAGAYADFRGDARTLNATRLKQMNFGLNWDAVFPYPYHGMWMPYAPFYHEQWENCFTHPTYDKQQSPFNVTYGWIEAYVRSLWEAGRRVGANFSTCIYGNLFEFGWNITDGGWPASTCAAPESCLEHNRCDSDRILWGNLSDAVIRDYQQEGKKKKILNPSGCLGNPCAMMDPAVPSYKHHLLKMTAAASELTSSAGLCIDRQDMVGTINPLADDGITLYQYQGVPSVPVVGRSTFFSFLTTMADISEMLFSKGMGVMINAHTTRIDMMKHVTGLFDEHGDGPSSNMKLSALATIAKPAIMWNHGSVRVNDVFLQSHLLLGVNFMAPFVDNDHSIHYPVDDSLFAAYGPLFAQLRSKQWVLAAKAVEVEGQRAQANFFHTRYGYAAPVVFAEKNVTLVNLTLRGVRGSAFDAAALNVSVLQPGMAVAKPLKFRLSPDGSISIVVPLGGNPAAPCAMVLVVDSSSQALLQPAPRGYPTALTYIAV